ncbi:hemagglutinin repeat-containing protein [Burkholderia pseudomallei]|uniref:hemagglutinin repeat-containing protein n=1 Tax=Burkholderia pseudomallei TaxID=28450 RepID=UPI001AD7D91A|nr:hemagglutinin repeat-containing protein [Burkholderia pseudomallei]MBO7865700.1 hemagglutinin repeat-containing protein [Burkholderia pseudomallei]MBO7877906.1 hemagglutinin repeat-containing protein [Burkholderia pseudomallei]
MNKNRYRVVFNRARGALMVVQENGRASRGTGSSGSRDASAGVTPAWLSLSPFALHHVALAVLVAAGSMPMWAHAQIVGAGANAPSVIKTQNGLDQVNINRPTGSSGVSMNTYSQFDVSKAGAVLNNSAQITNTQLAGYINGNPNLAPGQAARIIVNQVNSPNASFIRGPVEIGGQRAELVIANQNGLVLDGAGFMNTSKATLTTGVPFYGPDGSLAGYTINRGLVTVAGAGLNAANVDQGVDLLARAIQVNAAIYAKNLNVIAGANRVDANTLAATPIAGDGPAPAMAIDVSQLGGMYADRIKLIGTEHGVGVGSAGTIAAQAGDLVLQADGRLVLAGKTTASGNLTATGTEVQNSGTVYAQQNTNVSASGTVSNSGTIAAQQNVGVNAGSVSSTGTLGAGVNNDGSVAHSGDLNVTTSGALSATGQTVAGGNATLSGSSVNLAGSQTAANGNLSLNANAGDLNLTGATTSAQGTINANAAGALVNDHGSLSSGAAATLTAASISNQGGAVSSQGPLAVQASGQIANQAGSMVSQGAMQVRGGAIANNQGTLQSAAGMAVSGTSLDNSAGRVTSLSSDGLTVAVTNQLTNAAGTTATGAQGGVIGSNGDVDVQGGTVVNHGAMSAQANLHVTGQSVDNGGGSLQAGQNATIDAGSHFTNSNGTVIANQVATVNATTLDNSAGTTQAAQLALNATDLVNHGGTLTQTGTGPMAVNVSGTLDNSAGGTLQTNSTDLTLAPATFVNDGGAITHAGTGTLKLKPGQGTGAISNVGGQIVSAGQVIASAGSLNNAHGVLAAKNGIAATIAGDVNNNQGQLRSLTSLSLHNGGTLTDTNGRIQSGTGSTNDTSTLDIQSASIGNSGGLISNLGSGTTAVQGGSQLVNSNGTVTGNGDTTVSASSIVNTQGGQLSGTNLHVRGDALDNSDGTIGNVGNGDVDVTTTGAIVNTNGRIGSNQDLSVNANTLTGGGTYSAANDAAVTLQGNFTATPDFQFSAGHNLAFTLPGTFTNSAALQAVNNLSVDAGDIVNSGAIMAGNLLRTHSNTLTNTGAMVGGSASLVADSTLTNVGPTALIGASDSNGTLELLSRDIENRDDTMVTDTQAQTAIFGLGKVVLAGGKDASGNYTNAALIRNQSALIQSGGDMELHADKITNTRRVMTTTGYTGTVDPALLTQLGISMSGRTGQVGVSDPNSIGGAYIDPPHGGQWNSTYQYTTYSGVAQANTIKDISPAGQIVSGGNIDATSSGLLQNYWSNIAAVGNVKLPAQYDADGWKASGQQAPGVIVTYSGQYHYNNYDNTEHDWQLPFGDAPFVGSRPGGYTQKAPADIRTYKLPDYQSTLVSNGTISGTGVSLNNTAGNASIPSLGLLPGQSLGGVNVGGVNGKPGNVNPIIASATALNVLNNLTIPQGGLFKPTTAPNASYVIETNPAFTNQKNFISSDYFFQQLGVDLTHIPKRLGDGFYEQQLVRNEITALTGKAVLGPYTDIQSMYESLLASGAALSKSLNLPLGMSLSPEQVSQLTSNVILMETRVVGGQSVLVPVVYLAKASQENWNGPLIAANDIDLKNAQSFTNSGTMKAANTLSIDGKQIDNAFGALQSGGLTKLTTPGNIDLTSANVKAGSLLVNAGGDLILDTASKTVKQVSDTGATRITTTLGPQAEIDVTGDAAIVTSGNFQQNAGALSVGGDLGMNVGGNWNLGSVQTGEHKVVERANGVSDKDINQTTGSSVKVGGVSQIGVGGDLTAKGAQIELGQGGTMAVKGNATFGTASATSTVNSNSSGSDGHGSYAETLHTSDQALTGTTLKGGDTINIVSGKDTTVSGSTISLDKGNANLLAAGDVNVGAATETHELNSHETHSHSNVVSGAKIASGIDQTMTLNQGSLVSADGVNIVSGKDVNVQGSTIVGSNDVTLTAARNVTVTTSQDTLQSSSYYNKKESGLMSGGGLSVSIGSSSLKTTSQATEVSNNGSTIGSLKGNLSITAGNDLHVTGSDLIAAKNLSGTGANVTIDAAQDKNHRGETQEVSKSGLTLALKAPVIDAVSNAVGQSRASSNSQDGRAAALHGMAAASAAWDANVAAGDVVRALGAGETPQFKVEVSVGSSHSKSAFSEDSVTNRGSNVNAGGTVAFAATGNGQPGSGNVAIVGSNVNANDVILAAKNQVNIVNTTDTDSTRSTNESKSASVGVSVGTGGFGVSAAMSKANGDGNSDLATQNNSHVNAANNVTIISGGDTNIIGSNVKGKQVNADVGGNLNIASVQDTLSSAAHKSSSGGGFSVSQGGASASFSQSKGNASGSYAGINEQAGIHAGDGGFNINVTGNTDLKGGLIASQADASKNSLTTGSLSFSDIQNQSHYDASSSGFSAGATTGDGGMNYSTHGSTSGKNTGGAAPMLGQNDSGNDSATTKSGVSAGTVTITDSANQKQDVASLNRDTTNTNGTVAKLPDMQNLLANQSDMMAAASAAGEAVSRRIGDYADQMKRQAEMNGDQAGVDAWKEGGANRALMQGAGAALVTGLAGGNAVGGAAGAVIASIASGKLNELSSAIAGSDPTGNANMNQALGNIVANALATGSGAAVGGESGAFSGYNVDRFNRQLHPDERQWAKDKAKDFAKFYEEKTGKSLTADQAQNMLLANGYRLVDAAASKGPGGDATAVAYISQNGGGLFHATSAEYNSPFLSGNKDGSLTPEQRALPGAVANPKAGLVIAGGLVTAGLAPEIAAGLAAIPGAPIFGSTGALGSSAWASPIGIGVLTGSVNATSQYIQNGTVNPVDVGYAALAGGSGTYTKFFGNVVINAVTGALDTVTNNVISGKHDSIATGAAVNAGAAAIGYGTGLAMQNLISALSKSGMGSFGWSGTGVWAGSSGQNLFNPNNVPAIGAGIGGAAGAEAGTKAINDAKSRIGK